jgi:hypothetical protein
MVLKALKVKHMAFYHIIFIIYRFLVLFSMNNEKIGAKIIFFGCDFRWKVSADSSEA